MEKLRFLEIEPQSYSTTVDVPTLEMFKSNQDKK